MQIIQIHAPKVRDVRESGTVEESGRRLWQSDGLVEAITTSLRSTTTAIKLQQCVVGASVMLQRTCALIYHQFYCLRGAAMR